MKDTRNQYPECFKLTPPFSPLCFASPLIIGRTLAEKNRRRRLGVRLGFPRGFE